MSLIRLLAEIDLFEQGETEKNKEVKILLNDENRKIIQISLRNGECLNKHSAPSPIAVFCLAGNGIFKAGENLQEEQTLTVGTLIYLEKGIQHEVRANPNVDILVTKFSE